MSANDDSKSNTEEPSYRELSSQLNGLKTLVLEWRSSVEKILDERNHRFEDRFRAMDDKTALALMSTEKAIIKAEVATEKRFDSVNEFRGSLRDQAATLLPRAEADAKFHAFEEKLETAKNDIDSLRDTRSNMIGKEVAQQYTQQKVRWGLDTFVSLSAMFISGVAVIISSILLLLRFLGK